jgi:hypothetical protein
MEDVIETVEHLDRRQYHEHGKQRGRYPGRTPRLSHPGERFLA